jgi:hypothetical protein
MEELNYEDGMPRAPRSFWEPIEAAHGDINEFRKHLLTLERDELIKMYRIYKELELELYSDEHLARLEDNEDVIKDTASWVVMQGEEYYNEVYEDPEKTPSGDMLSPTFSGEIVGVFADRFNEWISVAAFPAR